MNALLGVKVAVVTDIRTARRTEMRYFSFEIVIEKEPEDEGYFAYSPTVPGCFSNGMSIEQAKRNIREAIAQHVDSLIAHGELIPQNDRIVHVEELTVGVPE